ncbi:hypothetical protein V6Z12_D09G013500 [Gossypium hirsutum]
MVMRVKIPSHELGIGLLLAWSSDPLLCNL